MCLTVRMAAMFDLVVYFELRNMFSVKLFKCGSLRSLMDMIFNLGKYVLFTFITL